MYIRLRQTLGSRCTGYNTDPGRYTSNIEALECPHTLRHPPTLPFHGSITPPASLATPSISTLSSSILLVSFTSAPPFPLPLALSLILSSSSNPKCSILLSSIYQLIPCASPVLSATVHPSPNQPIGFGSWSSYSKSSQRGRARAVTACRLEPGQSAEMRPESFSVGVAWGGLDLYQEAQGAEKT